MKNKVIGILILVALAGLVTFLVRTPGKPGVYDEFATCLKDKGATFYGAFWCPHCQNQKALFGKSAKLIPYKECSTPDGKSQLPECTEAGIETYPTWIYADGTKQTGEISLEDLAAKTQCVLPQ